MVKFCQAKFEGVIPEFDISAFPALEQHKQEVNKLLQEYITQLRGLKLRAGLSTVMRYVICTIYQENYIA